MPATTFPYIEKDANGVPILSGTQTKVVEVVLDRLAHHWDADEIHRQHPHLSLAQIYIALAYYYDHQTEMDEDIQERWQRIQAIQADLGESPVRRKLAAKGLLP